MQSFQLCVQLLCDAILDDSRSCVQLLCDAILDDSRTSVQLCVQLCDDAILDNGSQLSRYCRDKASGAVHKAFTGLPEQGANAQIFMEPGPTHSKPPGDCPFRNQHVSCLPHESQHARIHTCEP